MHILHTLALSGTISLLAIGFVAAQTTNSQTLAERIDREPPPDAAPTSPTQNLLAGDSLAAWEPELKEHEVDPAIIWSVKDGVLHCAGTTLGYLSTREDYEDYRLSLDWRWPGNPGNSGVLLHIQGEERVWPLSIEAQLQSENAGDVWLLHGADCAERERPHEDRRKDNHLPRRVSGTERTPGDWNNLVIIARGASLKIYTNGTLQNELTDCSPARGRIGLQSEGTPVEFRKIELLPIGRDQPTSGGLSIDSETSSTTQRP